MSINSIKMKNKFSVTVSALFTAIICIISQVCFLMPSGIAFTLQTLAIAFCGYILGAKWGTASVATYLLTGVVGLPVFSGFKGGVHILTGVTGGFLWGFILLVLLCGLSLRFNKKHIPVILGTVGIILCHLCGIIQYCFVADLGFTEAFIAVSLPFLLKDFISVILAFFLSKKIIKKIKILQ